MTRTKRAQGRGERAHDRRQKHLTEEKRADDKGERTHDRRNRAHARQ